MKLSRYALSSLVILSGMLTLIPKALAAPKNYCTITTHVPYYAGGLHNPGTNYADADASIICDSMLNPRTPTNGLLYLTVDYSTDNGVTWTSCGNSQSFGSVFLPSTTYTLNYNNKCTIGISAKYRARAEFISFTSTATDFFVATDSTNLIP